jgi:two-component system repressor protein LuxO
MSVNKRQALVIEDNRDIAFVVSKALQAAGLETEVMQTGDQAIAWLSMWAPDLIVLDLRLPQTRGQEILRWVRTAAHLRSTRVILITVDPLAAEGLEEEADLILLRPISFDQLRDLAHRLTWSGPIDRQAPAMVGFP